ncbi:MAG: cation transporter [Alicyclobacillus herbarius]|uniref:cation transporter n=1 Tax=Alicyclobacillus herbarius TaxID=122960 RepID=UPI002357CE53|nr:cation transporter [Alicyclobacillus herbarius]MCL6631071.1 cation transporter [Alicyclobacillus herbarius]
MANPSPSVPPHIQPEPEDGRSVWLKRAIAVEVMSLLWIAAEAVVSLVAARQTGTVALSAFGIDSAIEWISGACLLLRLLWERRHPENGVLGVERAASLVVGLCLFALVVWIGLRAGQMVALRTFQAPRLLGLAVAAASSVITPWLAVQKRLLGYKLDSPALLGDAACTMTCALMAWMLLFGLLVEQVWGFWWVDPFAALLLCVLILHEAWESVAAFRGGRHDHGHGHGVV